MLHMHESSTMYFVGRSANNAAHSIAKRAERLTISDPQLQYGWCTLSPRYTELRNTYVYIASYSKQYPAAQATLIHKAY